MDKITVDLDSRSYDIIIDAHLLDAAGTAVRKLHPAQSAAIVTNTTVGPLYTGRLEAALHRAGFKTAIIELPDGEQFKTLAHVEYLYSRMIEAGLDRQSMLIALGGGVIGDMTGFAAATFMRGIAFMQIPTTLLAQVDSSVGGKTGVNLPEGKNLVGAFHQPRLVLIDPTVLGTLPLRELQSGTAEVIKTATIADASFFHYLENNNPLTASSSAAVFQQVIATCCRIKATITSQDETEQGIRAFLNFGHTIGHAIETLTGYAAYTHGEAVAMGMAAMTQLSSRLGYCASYDAERVLRIIHNSGLPTDLPSFDAPSYVHAVLKDKKKAAESVKMVFLKKIGEVFLMEVTAGRLLELFHKELGLKKG